MPESTDKNTRREQLKNEMLANAELTKARCMTISAETIANQEKKEQKLKAQLASPATKQVLPPEECWIGNWLANQIIRNSSATEEDETQLGSRNDKLPKTPAGHRRMLGKIEIKNETEEDKGHLAYYAPQDDSITLIRRPNFYQDGNDYSSQFYNGNPVVINSTVYHEGTHKRHANVNNFGNSEQSFSTTARCDRLTETTAHAAEYLYVAQTYTELKKQNINTFQYSTIVNGEEKTVSIPLDNLLETYPGLKEALNGQNFSPDDTQQIRKIVAASSADWHKESTQTFYNRQAARNTLSDYITQPFSVRLQNIKNKDTEEKRYQEMATAALKDVYIGNNTTVDLTGCKDLLDTMDDKQLEEVKDYRDLCFDILTIVEQDAEYIEMTDDKDILRLDDYLEKKGITDNAEKDRYLEQEFIKIVTRAPDADRELKKLLLGEGGSIKYTDGLVETKIPGTPQHILTDDKGNTALIGANVDFSHRRNATDENTSAPNNAQNKTNTASFAPAQLHQLKERSGR